MNSTRTARMNFILSFQLAAAVLLLCLLIVLQLVSVSATNQLIQQNTAMLNLVELIGEQNQQAFDKLDAAKFETCSKENLRLMNMISFQSAYVKEVAFYEGDDLVCTSSLGVLDSPILYTEPTYKTQTGYSVWVDHNLKLFDNQYSALVIRRGRYNIVIDPVDLYVEGMVLSPWELILYWDNSIHPIAGREGLYEHRYALQGGQYRNFNRHYVETCSTNNTNCIASRLSNSKIAENHGYWLSAGSVLSLLVAIFSYFVFSMLLARRCEVPQRVKRLLKNREVKVVFQPIVCLQTQQIIGCEVLNRLEDNDGEIAPDESLPVIRRKKLTWHFTRQVIDRALMELNQQPSLPDCFKVAFNLFAKDIQQAYCLELTQCDVLQNSRFKIELEITEDQQLDNPSARQHVELLAESGFDIAIDDFGTGYSNLQHLQRIQCQYLKIDRSFVVNIDSGSLKASLVPHIVELANQFNLECIVEGIENEAQMLALQKLNIKYGQGYYFGKPMTAEELAIAVARNADTDKASA